MHGILNARSSFRAAFSLLELLIVIAIIAIFAALLLSAVIRSKSNAQQAKCLANLRQIGVGLQNFVADNHAYPSGLSGTNSDNAGSWFVQLERGGFGAAKARSNFWSEGVWRCPSVQERTGAASRIANLSYGYNAYGVGRRSREAGEAPTPTEALGLLGRFVSSSAMFAPIGESEVISPSEMIAVGESHKGVFFSRRAADRSRHGNRVNVTFCDGHVEFATRASLYEDTSDASLARWNRDHQPHREEL